MVLKTIVTYPPPWGPLSATAGEISLPLPEERVLQLQLDGDRLRHRIGNPDDSPDSGRYDLTVLSEAGEIIYIPMLPDRPMVLRASHSLRILPGGSLRALIPVPLIPALVLRAGGKSLHTILEVNVLTVSKTWFGDPVSGESAYGLNTPIDVGMDAGEPDPWVCLCPLAISNTSPEPLLFTRLILRVPYLALYAGEQRIYSNGLTVKFRGQDQMGQIQISGAAPQVDEPVRRIGEPRRRKDREIIRRSFSFFRSLYHP